MEYIFMAVVDETLTANRFVMADGDVSPWAGVILSRGFADSNGFYPVNHILKDKMTPQLLDNVKRNPWIGGLTAHI